MALITEDGTGKVDSESYSTVIAADSYHSLRGRAAWGELTESKKEQALRLATDYIEQVYRDRWKGTKNTGTQALSFPRSFIYVDSTISGDSLLDNNIVPFNLTKACAELALRSVSGDLLADTNKQIIRERVEGAIEVEYSENTPQSTQYLAVDSMLSAYLLDGKTGGGVSLTSQVERG